MPGRLIAEKGKKREYMVIRVLDHKYFVLRTISAEDGLDQYVCRDLVDEESNIYRIVRIMHADVNDKLLRYLADIEVEGSFGELREYASEDGYLCVVMDCGAKDAKTLSERITEEASSFGERLGYVSKLIERLILSNIPAYFAAAALSGERVKYTDAMDCAFDFDLHDILEYESYGMNDVCGRLADVITNVFERELKWNAMKELTEFIKDLHLHRYTDYLAIYSDFKAICEKYGTGEGIELENNSFPFQLWDMLKNLASNLRNMAAMLLIVLAVAYLAISVRNFLKPTQARDVYTSIGDMQIMGTGGDHQ
jgi:hypothetical protein